MTNDKKIEFLLDLDKPEYDDLFITSNDERELWQRDAMHSLVDKLTINLAAAKKYCKQRQENRKKTNLSHNSIFLTGERGSGKTAFLRNVEPIWQHQHKEEKALAKDIGFLDVIDPTMLMNNDSFANVVVAEIYRKVEEHCSDNNVSSADRTAFYNALKSLSESLGKQDEFNGHSGIDKILRYNSGIQVEKNFHRYVEEAIKILSCSALVLPIDDVDMSLQKAHEVIDDVRRLLGCPYIIPIVSGDVALYQQMINVDFDDRAYKKNSNKDLQKSGVELAKDLSDEYLKKVFPAQMRLPLNSLIRIIYGLNIKEGGKEKNFSKYIEQFYHKFYFLLHRQQQSNELPVPETARELTQLVRSFSLVNLNGKDGFILWSTYRSYSEAKKDAEGYVNALSYLIADSRRNSENFSLKELPIFNPLLQLNRIYSWAERDIYSTQVEAANRISATENSKFIERKLLESDKTLTSMPPYDYHNKRFYITKGTVKNEINPNQYLLDIYTSSNYYSTLGNTTPIVFVGRAFELIVLSFISTSINLQSQIARIMNDTPMHSVFSLNSTKHIGSSKSDDNHINDGDDMGLESHEQTSKWLSIVINDWQANNNELFDKIDNLDLLSIFAKMFNQVFTQISLLKSKLDHKDYEGENLSDFARRFEHICVNSALMNINDVNVVTANTSLTRNYETIRDYTVFSKTDRTLIRNFENLKNSLHPDKSIGVLFIEALWDHPIFKLNNSRDVLDDCYPLGNQNNTQRDKQINEVALQEVIDRLENGIVDHINSNKTDWSSSKKLVDRVMIDLDISGDVKEVESWLRENKGAAKLLNNIFDINGYFNYLSSAKESKAKRFLSAIRVI
ncbi:MULTISPECIES: hypothetical protein [Vibrio]|uniref:hypothetical protein n=1 Tax=Vibrio TaxID=662 RepID=UPI0010BD6993|nr:hypothetical protein [Vibrio sp. F12]TKE77699.1 hypothetical protein FCV54_19080 [Vibrio sp. F12]